MSDIIAFDIKSIKRIDVNEYNDEDYAIARVGFFSTRPNSHGIPITEKVLKESSQTVLGKWITADVKYGDCTSHTNSQIITGVVPKNQSISFVRADDGYLDAYVDCVISKKYSKDYYNIFSKDDAQRSVSIEATFQMDENDIPISFDIKTITTLGKYVRPAVPNAHIELVRFSDDKAEKYYNETLKFAENSIKIDNSKESAVDGSWENPRRKLLKPIIEASNTKALLNEAYLIPDLENPTTTNCKYPHHVIRDGKLVVHIGGLKAAFSRAAQQGIVNGKVKTHLLKHYHALGLNTENFAEFGFSQEEFNLYFSDESEGDNEMEDIKNFSATENEEVEEKEVDNAAECPECGEKHDDEHQDMAEDTKADDEKNDDSEDRSDDDTDDNKSDDDEKEDDSDDKDEKMSDCEKKCAELEVKCAELEKKCADLEADNKAYMAKCEAMSDYETLKQFKYDTEEKEAKAKKMAEIETVFSELSSKGFAMSDAQRTELTKKFDEYGNIDGFRNYVKAFAFDNMEQVTDGEIRMSYPVQETKVEDIWDEIRVKGLI